MSTNQRSERPKREPIMHRAKGRWKMIMQALIGSSVDWSYSSKLHQNCPMPNQHGKSKGLKKFRLCKDFEDTGACACSCADNNVYTNGIKLIAAYRGIGEREAAIEVAKFLDDSGYSAAPLQPVPPKPFKPYELNSSAIRTNEAVWDFAGRSKDRNLVKRYLQSRGFSSIPSIDVIREHSELQYYDEETNSRTYHPAMVSLIRARNGGPLALHRTYLRDDGLGKANVDMEKKQTTSVLDKDDNISRFSPAIRLFSFEGGRLHVGEGIETSLAAHHITNEVAWALINTSLMKAFVPPEGCTELVIWMDVDPAAAGQIAAAQLGMRIENQCQIPVTIMSPVSRVPLSTVRCRDRKVYDQIFQFLAKQSGFSVYETDVIPDLTFPDWADVWKDKQKSVA